jgi:hypothetical protein
MKIRMLTGNVLVDSTTIVAQIFLTDLYGRKDSGLMNVVRK